MRYQFDEFVLDLGTYELRRAGSPCPLEPQVFDVLVYLVRNHERMVPRDELIEQIWPERYISETALSSRVMAARKALGDTGRDQRYIRTVHGRGFRFVGKVTEPLDVKVAEVALSPAVQALPLLSATPVAAVGREADLAELQRSFEAVQEGRRQVIFLTGEAGIGKSTIADAFLARVEASGQRVMRGQCFEQLTSGEPYLPFLDALGRLARGPASAEVVPDLARHAPSWLAQFPALLEDDESRALRSRIAGATSERMLREAVGFLEHVSHEAVLAILLEDLQWADAATIDLLSALARHPGPARLLILGTYRPEDVRGSGHPLDNVQHDLRVRGLSREVRVGHLDAPAIGLLVASRFPGAQPPEGLGAALHALTEGNPLFLVNVFDHWVSKGAARLEADRWQFAWDTEELVACPQSLTQLIEQRADRLETAAVGLLEAASVVGAEFECAAVAHVLDAAEETVEEQLVQLARQERFIREIEPVELPGGAVTSHFAFNHSLYREVLASRIGPARRVRLHRAIAHWLEGAYGDTPGHASRMAVHSLGAFDQRRAIEYLGRASHEAMARGGHREALNHIETALGLAAALPLFERAHAEAPLLAARGTALVATLGVGNPGAEEAFRRACLAARETHNPAVLATATFGLVAILQYQGRNDEANEKLAELGRDGVPELLEPSLAVIYQALVSCERFHQGAFMLSVEHGEGGVALQEAGPSDTRFAVMGEDPAIGCRQWSGLALWFLGFPDRAVAWIDAAIAQAMGTSRDYSMASIHTHAARVRQLRREPEHVSHHAGIALRSAQALGFPYHAAVARMLGGWAQAAFGDVAGGLAEIEEALEDHQATGAALDRPYYLALHAETLRLDGQADRALAVVNAALAQSIELGPHFFEAELRRIRGELLLQAGDPDGARVEFEAAIAVAREQHARSLELRAATSLARQHRSSGQLDQGAAILQPVVAGIEEGLDTPDYRDALALLGDG